MTEAIAPIADGADLVATFPGSEWLHEFRRIDVGRETVARRTGTVESLCVVLCGTHDLFAGGGTWARRGLRLTPFDGRPVAIYLPPQTPYGSNEGRGSLLIVSVVQPPFTTALDARERLARKPLLPMLGSGKAYDPQSGEWKTRESFPDSAEALLPRRITRGTTTGGAGYERILGLDYKARGLCVDEAVLAVGTPLRFEPPLGPSYPSECAIWLEFEGTLTVDGVELRADSSPRALRCNPHAMPSLALQNGRGYALCAYAGTKPA